MLSKSFTGDMAACCCWMRRRLQGLLGEPVYTCVHRGRSEEVGGCAQPLLRLEQA
jgi:hypothetical protein